MSTKNIYTISLGYHWFDVGKYNKLHSSKTKKLPQIHVKLNTLYFLLYLQNGRFRGISLQEFLSFVDPRKDIPKFVRVPMKHPVYSYKS